MFRDLTHAAHFGIGHFEAPAPAEPVLPFGGDETREAAPEREPLELIGTYLRAAGSVDLGRFSRLSDYVNYLGGFFTIEDVTLLSRTGGATRVTFPDLRVRLADIAIVAQSRERTSPHAGMVTIIPKERRRLVVMTEAHIIYGSVFLHAEGSMSAFIDASDPHWIPMADVRVRWLTDRRLAGRFPFALLQRTKIVGIAADLSRPAAPARTAGHPAAPLATPASGILAQRKAAAGF